MNKNNGKPPGAGAQPPRLPSGAKIHILCKIKEDGTPYAEWPVGKDRRPNYKVIFALLSDFLRIVAEHDQKIAKEEESRVIQLPPGMKLPPFPGK